MATATNNNDSLVMVTCPRCGGTGRYGSFGRCFKCHGNGGEAVLQSVLDRRKRDRERRQRRKEEKRQREQAERNAQAEAFLAANPGLKAAFEADLDNNRNQAILDDMHNRLRRWGTLSEKQVAFALRLANPTPEPPAGPVPEGRVEVEGVVLTLKENDWGQYKMLVRLENGSKLWGTCPAAIDPKRGDKVAFTATCKAKERSFGFYSRPTKARVVEEAKAAA